MNISCPGTPGATYKSILSGHFPKMNISCSGTPGGTYIYSYYWSLDGLMEGEVETVLLFSFSSCELPHMWHVDLTVMASPTVIMPTTE